jgi:hypothetical protein
MKALHAKLKAVVSPPMMATMDLATQHFYYLLLKDPFATKEQHLALVCEAVSRVFRDKCDTQFEVTEEMLCLVSVTFESIGSN